MHFIFRASFDHFEQSFQTVIFLSWQSTKTVYIKIKDDDRVENTEALLKTIVISFLYHLNDKITPPTTCSYISSLS